MASAPRPQAPSPPAKPVTRRHGRTAAGLGAGITAGMIWGLAFLLPVLLGDWNLAAH
jgi:hypothetical protein